MSLESVQCSTPVQSPRLASSSHCTESKKAVKTIIVRNIPQSITQETFVEQFSSVFPIKHATLILHKTTGVSRGFGFVTFNDWEDASRALKLYHRSKMFGRMIFVSLAKSRPEQRADTELSRVVGHCKEQDRGESKLIIRNLPWSCHTESAIRSVFDNQDITEVTIPRRSGAACAGFAFVTFRSRDSALQALAESNGRSLASRTLAIDWAVDKSVWESSARAQQNFVHTNTNVPISSIPSVSSHASTETGSGNNSLRLFSEDRSQKAHGNSDIPQLTWQPTEHDLFVRNLPFSCDESALFHHFSHFGALRYARLVLDAVSRKSKGSAFISFQSAQDAAACLHYAPNHTSNPASSARSSSRSRPSISNCTEDLPQKLTDLYSMDGRLLSISKALSREMLGSKMEQRSNRTLNISNEDRRHIHLLLESNKVLNEVKVQKPPPMDLKLREEAITQRIKMLKRNSSFHVSLTRLSIRNLPKASDAKILKFLSRQAVVCFAKEVKAGSRARLSQAETNRDLNTMRQSEALRRKKGHGIIRQAKILHSQNMSARDDPQDKFGKSQATSAGFVEFTSHRWALMALRWLNGRPVRLLEPLAGHLHPGLFGESNTRIIAEFAVENMQVLNLRQAPLKGMENHSK